MPELSNEAQLILIVWALVQVVKELVGWLRAFTRDDAKADQTAAHERQQWMALQQQMLTTVLESNSTRYQKFTDDVFQRFDSVVEQIQTNFTTALEALVEQISTQMAPVTQQRQQQLEAIHSAVTAVPNDVWTLGDPKLEGLTSGIRAELEPLITDLQETIREGFGQIEEGIAERLEALGNEASPALRGILNQELTQYHNSTQRQLEKIRLMLEALREDLDHTALAQDPCGRDQKPIVIGQGRDSIPGVSCETPDRAASESATPSDTKSEELTSTQENNDDGTGINAS